MLKKYNDFIFESLLLESALIYSDKFKNLIKDIDSPVAKALQEIESKDLKVTNNFIDISDDKEQISFTPDRRAQQILNPENVEKFVIYTGDGGFLRHSEGNKEIFTQLGYEPVGDKCYHPEVGEKGEVLSKVTSETSGKTYLKLQYPGGVTVVNQSNTKYEDVSKLPFTQGRQSIRIGRGIKGLLTAGDFKFTDAEIEKFVNLYKAAFEKMNDVFRHFEVVKGDDIAFWYKNENYELGRNKGTLSTSCMCSVPASFFKIYTKNPDVCQLLILKTEDGKKIKGRALVWTLTTPEGITYMDRQYTHNESDVELFRLYAKSKGWYYKPNNNHMGSTSMIAPDGSEMRTSELRVKLESGDYDKYPYLDTLKWYTPHSGVLSTSSGDYQLEDTGGGWIGNEDCDYCGGDGRVDCPDCDGDGDVECSDCGGNEEISCSDCDGEGEVECSDCDGTGKDGEDDCSNCSGKGKVECTDCGGSGNTECGECNGRGRVECNNCDGSGRTDCPECG